MTEVAFYHLEHAPLERVLPKLLEKAIERGYRALVRAGSPERVEALNTTLWTYDPDSFLAHGAAADGHAAEQPIYLTTGEENPNNATVLVLVDGADYADIAPFERCLDVFDGNDPAAVAAARERWSRLKGGGHQATYWQQSPEGRWEQKA